MLDSPTDEVTVIGRDGRVRHVRRWEVSHLMRDQGMRIIRNPKQEYYFEYDEANQAYTQPTENIIENIEESDLLPVVEV